MKKNNYILKEASILLVIIGMMLSATVITATTEGAIQTCIADMIEAKGYLTMISNPASSAQNCGGPVIFSQLPAPDDSSAHGPYSDAYLTFRCYENFWGLTDSIHDVHWWGLWDYGSNSPTPGDTFEISFCTDNGGIPNYNHHIVDFVGALGAEITYVGTGKYYWGSELYYMEMDLPTPVSMESGWISFYKTNINSQEFAWISATTGDGNSYQTNSGTHTYDLAFQLTGALAELEIQNVAGGLGVSAEIVNIGPVTAENVNWELRFEGGVIISPTNGIVTGGPLSIPALGNLPISTSAFGFGGFILPLNIVITGTADNALPVNTTYPAKLFLIFVSI